MIRTRPVCFRPVIFFPCQYLLMKIHAPSKSHPPASGFNKKLLSKCPLNSKATALTVPHPGQGNPVTITTGQKALNILCITKYKITIKTVITPYFLISIIILQIHSCVFFFNPSVTLSVFSSFKSAFNLWYTSRSYRPFKFLTIY